MGLKRVSWVRRYQGQCRALRPLRHQGYRLRNYKKDPPLCSGYSLLKTLKKTKTVAIRVGDGRTIHSLGGVDVTMCLGDETVTQHCRVLDTDAFDIVIYTDFLRRNPQVKMLSLQRPYSLHCVFGSGLFSVPLELSGRKESGLRYASKTNYRTENYQLARHVLKNGLAALQGNLDEIQVKLFGSQQQHIMQLYCSKQLNNAFRFFWKAMGLAYANPPFSLLAKVLTKIAYEGGRVVMCTPDGAALVNMLTGAVC